MIFSTTKAAEIQTNDVAYLGTGIHENVSFVNARTDKSSNGNNFIEFEFNKDGSKLTHTEWEPTKFSNQTDTEFEEKINKQVARILQIMSPFYTKEQLNFEASSFAAFAAWTVSLMNSADKTKLVRLKVILGKNGYTSLPQYAKYTFIESMSVATEASKIKELKNIDNFTLADIADKAKDATSSAQYFGSAPAAAPVATGDAPF